MIYFDSSAIMKLIRREVETDALITWLNERPQQAVATSELGRIEVLRAAHRLGERVLAEARAVMDDLDLVPLDRTVQDMACELGTSVLRTLDALHLASALLIVDELTDFVAYDQRLIEAATAVSLPVRVPGR